MRVRRTTLAAALAITAVASAGPAAAQTDPTLGAARLAGNFQLAGQITTAVRVPGERKGQTITRTWSFVPTCQIGACPTVGLLRRRSNGADRLILTRKRPGYYVGNGSFYAPLRCGRTMIRRGLLVPFTVSVTVTMALRDPNGTLVATRVNATYTNNARRNLTTCVAVPGHDAASYHGHVLIGSSSGGSSASTG